MQRFKFSGQVQRFLSAPSTASSVCRARLSARATDKIPNLAGNHGFGPGRLKQESGETPLPRPGLALVQIS
jgi:hypothetical protein